MIKIGDILTGIVLEDKEDTAVIKFGLRPIEAEVQADLETGEKVKVQVKGWHNGKLLLKVLKRKDQANSSSIDFKA
ncbi:MAG: hypothetical protein ACQERJ_08415 [Bacillota bacterium]